MRRTLLWIATLTTLSSGAVSAAPHLQAEIASYECGDNCYLTVIDGRGEEHTGLCRAPLCEKWNEETTMPKRFVGQAVRIKVGKGKQLDGEGNVMGTMESFDQIELLTEQREESADSSHCGADESNLFSCTLSNGKVVSLCGSAQAGYLQYRFGKPDQVELALPARRQGIPQELSLSHSADDSAEYNSISFMNGENFIYELTSFRQLKPKNKEGMDTPPSSDTLTVRDQRRSMREGDIVFTADCAELGEALDAVGISDLTGVKWERAGF